MYLGLDFLIDKNLNLFLSEVNTGLPGGAQEYDYTFMVKYGKPSDVFECIEKLCQKNYRKTFYEYINGLSHFNSLREFKIWMDGQGKLPLNFPPILRLEDKWTQYLILSQLFPVIKTQVLTDSLIFDKSFIGKTCELAVKKRLGRGGRGFFKIKNFNDLKNNSLPKDGSFIIQPYIDSSISVNSKTFNLSIRALSFSGRFICMYANLSEKITSNHGILFYIEPGAYFGLSSLDFEIKKFRNKAWEADLFYSEKIPEYLYHNLYEDEVAKAELVLPERIFKMIKRISASVSSYYEKLDYDKLPRSYVEKSAQ